MLPLPGRESILITFLVIFLFLLPALMLSIYYWYRQENSLLYRWVKEMRQRSQEACRCVGHPKPFSLEHPVGLWDLFPSLWGAGGARTLSWWETWSGVWKALSWEI